jgi:hypothetical protein
LWTGARWSGQNCILWEWQPKSQSW